MRNDEMSIGPLRVFAMSADSGGKKQGGSGSAKQGGNTGGSKDAGG